MDTLADVHIRRRLERELRRELPDEIWADLVGLLFVDDAIERDGWSILVKEARRCLGYVEIGARGRINQRKPQVASRPSIEARGRAYQAWAARLVGGEQMEAIRAIWGGLISREEAAVHLRSAAWLFVPIADLTGRTGGGLARAGDAPRIRKSVARVRSRESEERAGVRGIRLELDLEYGSERRELVVWHKLSGPRLTIRLPGKKPLDVIAFEGTFASYLIVLAGQVRSATPFSTSQMLCFLLTDEAPEFRPLTIGVRDALGSGLRWRYVVELEVEPWVPVHAVAAAYREAQVETLGRTYRPLRGRSVELARFLAMEGWGKSVREQMRAWNESHPRQRFHDPRNFQRHARRAEALLLGPEIDGTI